MEFGFIELALLVWSAFEAGKWWANYNTKKNMKELLDDLGVPRDEQLNLQQKTRDMIMGPKVIILTKMGDMYFAHDEDEVFLGQDKDREELFKYIAKTCGEGRYEVVDKT